jgi:hypothetical protein
LQFHILSLFIRDDWAGKEVNKLETACGTSNYMWFKMITITMPPSQDMTWTVASAVLLIFGQPG